MASINKVFMVFMIQYTTGNIMRYIEYVIGSASELLNRFTYFVLLGFTDLLMFTTR